MKIILLIDSDQVPDDFQVLMMGAMGKIEAEDIDTSFCQLEEALIA